MMRYDRTVNAVCIPAHQRSAHVASEAVAILTAVPFLFWAATRSRELTKAEKAGLIALGVGTLVIDGYLLHNYLRQP